jgi:hypothetical protein
MGKACSTNGEKRNAWWENQKERDNLENQDVGGWTMLKWS